MFKPLFAFIGLRYTWAKRKNHFISFISLSSMLGIALGVMVLITVLSVMNGFGKEIRSQILSVTPHITLQSSHEPLDSWQSILATLKQNHKVQSSAPYTIGQGMLTRENHVQGVLLMGIDPNHNQSVYPVTDHLISGTFANLKEGTFGIILGREMARVLSAKVGDKVTVVVPETLTTLAGVQPRMKRFTVVGIFQLSHQYDNSYAFMHLKDANTLFHMGAAISGIQMKVANPLEAPKIADNIAKTFDYRYSVFDWTSENENLFKAIKMEKTVMTFILLLIIAVAAFNLVSSLVMMVTDKRSDIAILRTMGASPTEIMGIFVMQGALIGVIGTLLGVIGGVLLAMHVTEIVECIQKLLGVYFISRDIYFIDFLPSELLVKDILQVCGFSILMSLIATIYPAKKAATVQPAEALRYE